MLATAESVPVPGSRELGRAWILLCVVLLIHVVDEALTGFLSVYNPTVIALRKTIPWLPVPTFGFALWFIGLLAVTAALLLLSPFAFRGSRLMRPAGYIFGAIMVANGLSHIAQTIAGRTLGDIPVPRAMPGVYSSPLMLAAAAWLLFRLAKPSSGLRLYTLWAWTCAGATFAAGAVSLLLFMVFLWNGGFHWVDLRMDIRTAMLWDAGLCLLFFLQHSGMVRKPFRMRLGRVLAPHWHRVVYSLASAAALAALVVFWQPSGVSIATAGAPARWALFAVFIASMASIAWAFVTVRESDLFGVEELIRRVSGKPQTHPPALLVRGPYRLVRHPFYACGIAALWLCPSLSLDRLLFDILFTCWLVAGAKLEERDLAAEFGGAYREYQRKVPMLIPWPRRRA